MSVPRQQPLPLSLASQVAERPSWIPASLPLLLPPDAPVLPRCSAPLCPPGASLATIAAAKPSPFTFPVGSLTCGHVGMWGEVVGPPHMTRHGRQVERSAVVVIDMQRDFILAGGFGSTLGNKVELLQAIVPNVAKLLVRVSASSAPAVVSAPLLCMMAGQVSRARRAGDTHPGGAFAGSE